MSEKNVELIREINKLCIIAKEPNCLLLVMSYVFDRISSISIELIQEELQKVLQHER